LLGAYIKVQAVMKIGDDVEYVFAKNG